MNLRIDLPVENSRLMCKITADDVSAKIIVLNVGIYKSVN